MAMDGEYRQGNLRGACLFQALLHKAAVKEYDDDFLALLAEYYQLYPESDRFAVFYARYAIAYGNYAVALEYGQKAYEKRKVNLEVWKILAACYKFLDQPLKALIYQGYGSKFYNLPLQVSVPQDRIPSYMNVLSVAMGIGNFAPFAASRMEYSAQGLHSHCGVFAGEYLPLPDRSQGYSYWVGSYAEQESLDAKGWLLSEGKQQERFAEYCGADFVFDIMKSKTFDQLRLDVGSQPILLPVAGTEEKQELQFSVDKTANSIWVGKWAYSFFRLEEPTAIASKAPFIVGEPIRLGHSPQRKKLVLHILVDALSWPVMKNAAYRYMPNLMRFFSQGIIFNNHFSAAEYTYPSFASIETGMYPYHSQIFNERASHPLKKEYKTMSEQMKALGYYCANLMGGGDGIYNGSTRGYDRLLINSYALHAYAGVERVIRQLEAFGECDQFLLLHIMDVHSWAVQGYQVPIATQTKLPLAERLAGDETKRASVYLPHTPLYMSANQQGMANVDRSLQVLFDYLTAHYSEQEYIVQLYSDHGVPIYDQHPDIVSENQMGAALMMRGGGIPALGVVDELTSAVDIYPILAHHAGFAVGDWVDGNLPAALGGTERDCVFSNSLCPGQTYKLCIRTKQYAFRLESLGAVDEDGTVDLSGARYCLSTRGGSPLSAPDEKLVQYFLRQTEKYTASFNNEGQGWPSMRQARPEWFPEG